MIRAVERLSGRKVPFRIAARRAGDPPTLVANPARMQGDTGWTPQFADLDAIVGTALAWRQAHPRGYGAVAAAGARMTENAAAESR